MDGQLAETYLRNIAMNFLSTINIDDYFEKGFFTLAYQMQYDCAGAPKGVEALLRLKHPHLGCISPDIFIPLFEADDRINRVGYWVIKKALVDCKAFGLFGEEMTLSINVSPMQLVAGAGFSVQLATLLKKYNVRPDLVIVELTENAPLDNCSILLGEIIKISNLGVSLSLDDFGSGYRNVEQLYQFPIDELKIDKTMINGIDTQDCTNSVKKRAILKAMVEMGAMLSIAIVVEGIETESQLDTVSKIGYDIVQGFYFSRPMKIKDLCNLIEPTKLEAIKG